MSKHNIHSGIIRVKLTVNLLADTPKTDSIYLTGNLLELGEWDPAGKKLTQAVDGTYYTEFNARKNSAIQLKITRGNWQTQAITTPGQVPPKNMIFKLSHDQTLEITIHDWLDKTFVESDPVIGQLTSIDNFECRNLRHKRPIAVWLPNNYSETSEPFMTIYMHDGQNLFEPKTSYTLTDWKVDETLSSLMNAGLIKNTIVVGIPNSPLRMQELNLYTSEGRAYAEFIVNEVIPYVNKNYNVSKEAEDRVIAGSSMGGLMSFQMAMEYSDYFKKAACFSSAFSRSGNDRVFKYVKENAKDLPFDSKIYLDTGEYEEVITKTYFDMMELLISFGFEEGENLAGYFAEKAIHTETAWAERFHIPMLYLLGKEEEQSGLLSAAE
ncbi:MAG: hypothetical protein GX221_03855 [Candidatus Riflebacteria bacterium]|nr:hypothetical protein [Candidatus Riflebacteria bacterium]